ncbi:MAG: hypothetical protein HYR64_03720 [Fimbriimonas ginsengisoli]|uniref:Uncharacterized protein n=1 Tax=Fimbriimonas ginsengisoli TaxID=1005039 RepID=A0A931LRS4_FIMGI|nr:hypothetical protein [Fimbriimonas ginsengisoli]
MSSPAVRALLAIRDRTFRTRIEVLVPAATPNAAGGQAVTWSVEAVAYGRLRRPRRLEYLAVRGEEPMPEAIWEVLLPAEVAVDATKRLRASGLLLAVIGSDAHRTEPLAQLVRCLPVAGA